MRSPKQAPQLPLEAFAWWALWLFVASIPSEKSVEIPGLGTISRFLGIFAMGLGGLAVLANRRLRIPSAFHSAMAVFILWSAASIFWSIMPEYTEVRLKTYIQLFAMILLVWQFCPGEEDVMGLLNAYVVGTAIPVADTVHRFFLGTQTYYQRYATTGFDPNDLALTLSLSLPMSYYLSLRRTDWRMWLYRAQIVAATGIILLTASRGGIVTTMIALSLAVTTRNASGLKSPGGQAGAIAAVVVAVLVAAIAIPASTWKRLASLTTEVSEGTLNSRTVLWRAGFVALQDAPLRGVGAGAYPESVAPVMGRPRMWTPVAHNSFLSVLVETGLAGFALFAVAIVILIVTAVRMQVVERRLWLTMLAAWAIGVCALTWEHRKPTWIIFGLLPAHAAARLSSGPQFEGVL